MSKWFNDLSLSLGGGSVAPARKNDTHHEQSHRRNSTFSQYDTNVRYATTLDSQRSKLIFEVTNLRDRLNQILSEVKNGDRAFAQDDDDGHEIEISISQAKEYKKTPQPEVIVLGWNKCGHCKHAKAELVKMRKENKKHCTAFHYLETEGKDPEQLKDLAGEDISAVPVIIVTVSDKVVHSQKGYSDGLFDNESIWIYLEKGDFISVNFPFTLNDMDDVSNSFRRVHVSDRNVILEFLGSKFWTEHKFGGFLPKNRRTLWCKEGSDDHSNHSKEVHQSFFEHLGTWRVVRGSKDPLATVSIRNIVSEIDGTISSYLTLPNMQEGPVNFAVAGRDLVVVNAPSLSAEFVLPLRGLIMVGMISGQPYSLIRELPSNGPALVQLISNVSIWPTTTDYTMFHTYLPRNDFALMDFAVQIAAENSSKKFIRNIILKGAIFNTLQRNRLLDSDDENEEQIVKSLLHECQLVDHHLGSVLLHLFEDALFEKSRLLFLELQAKIDSVIPVPTVAAAPSFRQEKNLQSCPFPRESRPPQQQQRRFQEPRNTDFSLDDAEYVNQILKMK